MFAINGLKGSVERRQLPVNINDGQSLISLRMNGARAQKQPQAAAIFGSSDGRAPSFRFSSRVRERSGGTFRSSRFCGYPTHIHCNKKVRVLRQRSVGVLETWRTRQIEADTLSKLRDSIGSLSRNRCRLRARNAALMLAMSSWLGTEIMSDPFGCQQLAPKMYGALALYLYSTSDA